MLTSSSRRRSNQETLSAVAYHQIKEKIVTLALPPASLLDESALAADLQVGLTPVRQALRRLALENLVVIWPRRGTMVADLNLSDLQKLFEMRIELEVLAARLAAIRRTPEQLVELDALVKTTMRHVANLSDEPQPEDSVPPGENARPLAPDNRMLLQLDHQMHQWLARAAHNEFLEETLDYLYSHVLRLWNLSIDRVTDLPTSLADHVAIAQAVEARDAERAAVLMREHVRHFQHQIANLLQMWL